MSVLGAHAVAALTPRIALTLSAIFKSERELEQFDRIQSQRTFCISRRYGHGQWTMDMGLDYTTVYSWNERQNTGTCVKRMTSEGEMNSLGAWSE